MGHPLPPGHSYSRKSYSTLPCCAGISAALILPNVYGDAQPCRPKTIILFCILSWQGYFTAALRSGKARYFLFQKLQAGAATLCWVMIEQMHFYKKG
jgi:hypothetical protein